MPDRLLPFMFEAADVRGAVVSLGGAWREVLLRRAYPPAVRSLLGEAFAAAALLSSSLKFEGSMVLQAQASGAAPPVRLLVVECNADLSMRAMATLGDTLPDDVLARTLAGLIGDGKLVITLDPKDGQPAYQGVVSLEGGQLNHALEHYMLHSEQLETRIWLAADDARAGGLMIQKMPGTASPSSLRPGGTDALASRWEEAAMLAATIESAELLTLAPRVLLRRLFHEFDLRVFDERAPCYRCSCSRERVSEMLRMLGHDEVRGILAEQGQVTVNCEFCDKAYAFDAIDAAQLFITLPGSGSGLSH